MLLTSSLQVSTMKKSTKLSPPGPEAPGEKRGRGRPKGPLSERELAARRSNLRKARAAPKELIYRPTPKRQAASRANMEKAIAARRAPEGNANARLNALKHGLFARRVRERVSLLGESLEEFAQHLALVERLFAPQDAVERELVLRLAETLWRRLRLFRAQERKERNAVENWSNWAGAFVDATETERRAQMLLFLLHDFRDLFNHLGQLTCQVESLLRALSKQRSGGLQGFQMYAPRRDSWVTRIDSAFVAFDEKISDPDATVSDALKVLEEAEEKTGEQGSGAGGKGKEQRLQCVAQVPLFGLAAFQ